MLIMIIITSHKVIIWTEGEYEINEIYNEMYYEIYYELLLLIMMKVRMFVCWCRIIWVKMILSLYLVVFMWIICTYDGVPLNEILTWAKANFSKQFTYFLPPPKAFLQQLKDRKTYLFLRYDYTLYSVLQCLLQC
jgi:hypothetical protein